MKYKNRKEQLREQIDELTTQINNISLEVKGDFLRLIVGNEVRASVDLTNLTDSNNSHYNHYN